MLTDMRRAIRWVQENVKIAWFEGQESDEHDSEGLVPVIEEKVQLRPLPCGSWQLRIPLAQPAWDQIARASELPHQKELIAESINVAFFNQVCRLVLYLHVFVCCLASFYHAG